MSLLGAKRRTSSKLKERYLTSPYGHKRARKLGLEHETPYGPVWALFGPRALRSCSMRARPPPN